MLVSSVSFNRAIIRCKENHFRFAGRDRITVEQLITPIDFYGMQLCPKY